MLPSIMTANTFFWRSSGNRACRLRTEKRHLETVSQFFEGKGWLVDVQTHRAVAKSKDGQFECQFSYVETSRNVYKHCQWSRLADGKWKRTTLAFVLKHSNLD